MHPTNGGRRANCERIKGCQARVCSPLLAAGPSGAVLYDACLGSCHSNSGTAGYPGDFESTNQYLCATIDGVDLVQYYGINPCDVDETQTPGYVNEQTRKEIASSNNFLLWGLAGALVFALVLFLRKK
jgi:hypothetical protein